MLPERPGLLISAGLLLGGKGIDACARASFCRAISECHAISNGTRRKPFGFLLAIIGRVLWTALARAAGLRNVTGYCISL